MLRIKRNVMGEPHDCASYLSLQQINHYHRQPLGDDAPAENSSSRDEGEHPRCVSPCQDHFGLQLEEN